MSISLNSLISIFILIFFIIRTHGIAGYIQTIWAIPLLIIFIFSFYLFSKLTKQNCKFLLKESRWLILSIFILFINIIYKHGNFKLYETIIYLSFSIPFYIIGFYWGVREKDKIFRKLIVFFFVFISFYLLSKIVQVNNFSIIDRETLGLLFYNPKGEISFNNLIFFWPFCAFVAIIGSVILWDKNKGIIGNYSVLCLTAICLVSFFFAGLAAPIVLIIFSIFIFYFIKFESKGRLWFIVGIPIFLLCGFGIVYLLGSGILGHFGTTTYKANGILTLIESGSLFDEDILNIITSDRWTAGTFSISQFIKSPIWGQGAYLEPYLGGINKAENYVGAAGGHSFVLDTLAFYGIFGIPLILMLTKFVKDAYKVYKISSENNKFLHRVYAAVMTSLFISNILNSTFLFSNFDNFVFLCSGFFLGVYYVEKNRNIIQNK